VKIIRIHPKVVLFFLLCGNAKKVLIRGNRILSRAEPIRPEVQFTDNAVSDPKSFRAAIQVDEVTTGGILTNRNRFVSGEK